MSVGLAYMAMACLLAFMIAVINAFWRPCAGGPSPQARTVIWSAFWMGMILGIGALIIQHWRAFAN